MFHFLERQKDTHIFYFLNTYSDLFSRCCMALSDANSIRAYNSKCSRTIIFHVYKCSERSNVKIRASKQNIMSYLTTNMSFCHVYCSVFKSVC